MPYSIPLNKKKGRPSFQPVPNPDVHIFFNYSTPDYFPLNKSIFTGKLTGRQYESEHRLDYDRLGIQPGAPPVAMPVETDGKPSELQDG